MGDTTDLTLDGTLCNLCWCPFEDGESTGHPRMCDECEKEVSEGRR